MNEYLEVFFKVIQNKNFIITLILFFLVISFGCYVANYVKKPKQKKKKKSSQNPPRAKTPSTPSNENHEDATQTEEHSTEK